MFDIEEFYKARKRLFKNQNNINSLSELQKYIFDLKLVCANERSSELAILIQLTITIVKDLRDEEALFDLYWEYFLQIYYFIEQRSKTEETIDKMKKINDKSNNIGQKSRIYQAESLVNQLKNNKNDAITLMEKTISTVENNIDLYPEIYYSALYSYSSLTFTNEQSLSNSIENMEKCLEHYSKSHSMRGLILTIHQLLRFYLYSKNEKKIEELLQWVFKNRQMQKDMLDNHYILFNYFIGIMFTIRNRLVQAVEHLYKSYSKITEQALQEEMMYEYTDTLRFLSRCYAYQGDFQKAYNLLVDLIGFMESNYARANYYARGKKYISISSYYTILFIFVQLDLDIENIKDEKLKRVYEYTNSILMQSNISEELVLETFTDDDNLNNLPKDQRDNIDNEISVVLHQLLLTHVPYQNPEKNVNNIEKVRKYAFEPLYADILQGKILLSIGNYEKFNEIVKQINKETTNTKAPIIKIWRDVFTLLSEYIDNPENEEITTKMTKLANHCRINNFMKMEEEIKLYRRLISSTRTINQFTKKIKQTAFMDMYDNQSKKVVMEYLETLE